jgi:hypothetical protein
MLCRACLQDALEELAEQEEEEEELEEVCGRGLVLGSDALV